MVDDLAQFLAGLLELLNQPLVPQLGTLQLRFDFYNQQTLFICLLSIAYSIGQIIKSVCVCQSASTLKVAFRD